MLCHDARPSRLPAPLTITYRPHTQIAGKELEGLPSVEAVMMKTWNGGQPTPEFNNAAQVGGGGGHSCGHESACVRAGGRAGGRAAFTPCTSRRFSFCTGTIEAPVVSKGISGRTGVRAGWWKEQVERQAPGTAGITARAGASVSST